VRRWQASGRGRKTTIWSAATLALVGVGLWAAGQLRGEGPLDPIMPSRPGPPVVVWAVGDGADGGSHAKDVVRRIASGEIDRLLYLGDLYDGGGRADFIENYEPTYGHFKRITEPTVGDNDWPRRSEGYYPYWRSVRGNRLPPWYAFSVAGWQILSLNSEAPHGPTSRQLRWLAHKLDRTPDFGNCRVAFWHRPRFSAARKYGNNKSFSPFWRALRHRARLVLNGHAHDMQRFAPRGGITQFISGTGGHGLYGLRTGVRGLRFGDDRHYGALRIGLGRGRARFAFVADSGEVLHSGRLGCRRGRA
jgi:hypothetical protein